MLPVVRAGLAALTLLYDAGLVAFAGAVAVGAAREGWLAALREVAVYRFAPLPILLVAGLVLRARLALALALLPLGLFGYSYGPSFLPPSRVVAAVPSLRVMSFNVGEGMGFGQAEPVLRAVRAVDPDVICLQEMQGPSVKTIVAELSSEYPHRAANGGVFTFSRFPLVDPRPIRLRVGAHPGLLTDLVVGDRLVALANVHLLRTDGFSGWRGGPSALFRMGSTYQTVGRDAAAAELVGLLRDTGGPHVLVGDFNMTPSSYAYQELTATLLDSYREAGWGFGHTHPSNLGPVFPRLSVPLQRIDFIFHSSELVAVGARVGPDGGSNHLPVVADLTLR